MRQKTSFACHGPNIGVAYALQQLTSPSIHFFRSDPEMPFPARDVFDVDTRSDCP
jgi:hypothetical protein